MRTLMIAAMLLAGAPATAQPGHTSLLTGDWHGVGLQVGPDGVQSSWDIALSIKPDHSGAITYPSLGCKGVLHRVTSTSSQIEFTEKITDGNCFDGGHISATVRNGRLFWFWTMRGANADASAVLYPSQPIS
ncbi:MAG: hypothetical protein ABMA14_15125 [Hyphomonadaceae bacterium]